MVPRKATGEIQSRAWKDGRTVTWRLRFSAPNGRQRITLGTNHEGWNEARAQVELDRVLAMVERGTWQPPDIGPTPTFQPEKATETMQVTTSRWWQHKQRDISGGTPADYRWRLRLIQVFFDPMLTADVDKQTVDEFREVLAKRKTARGKLMKPRSINMILDLLAQILDDAVEYELLDANPARGKRRRMKVKKSSRSFLEADMVVDLLGAAGEWERELAEDRKRPDQAYGRRALLALLCLAGPRISEALAADRGDFDLANGLWRIPAAKTDAGERDVELTALLAAELRSHVAMQHSLGRPVGPNKPMWMSRTGGRLNPENIRSRLLPRSVEKANEGREEMQLPARVTPHTLRRTFASLALAAGRDVRWVMAQLGHTDPRLTLSVYAQVVTRKQIDAELVWSLMRFSNEPEVAEGIWTPNGTTAVKGPSDRSGTIPRA